MTNIISQYFTPILILGSFLLGPSTAGMAATPEEAKHMNNGNECLVILGASYARAWDINELMGCSVINRGVDGNQSFEMNERFDKDVITHNPQYVLLWGFINDIFRSDPEKLDQTVSRIKDSYRDMVAKSRQHGIEPILATEVTIRGPGGLKNSIMSMLGRIMGKTSYQEYINGHVISTNSWLMEFASKEKLQIIDFKSILANAEGIRKAEYATEDGSHITAAAYQALTKEARKQLDSTVQ